MSIKFWHDWQFVKVNWVDFTFVRLYYERDFITGTSEIAAGLFGLHVSLGWVHDRAKLDTFKDEAEGMVAQMNSESGRGDR